MGRVAVNKKETRHFKAESQEAMMAGSIKVKLTRSPIGHPEKHRKVLAGLGLTKVNSVVVRQDTPQIRGMIKKISHLVNVEEA